MQKYPLHCSIRQADCQETVDTDSGYEPVIHVIGERLSGDPLVISRARECGKWDEAASAESNLASFYSERRSGAHECDVCRERVQTVLCIKDKK